MSFDTLFVVVAALWMVVLSLVSLGLVRQIGLLTVRLDRDRQASAPINDGLDIGEAVPEAIASQVAVDDNSVGYLVILGAVCAPCRELATDLHGRTVLRPVTVLVSGREELAESLVDLLPPGMTVIRDMDDGKLAGELRIETTPFAFEIIEGRVRGKAVLQGADHLLSFIQPPDGQADRDSDAALIQIQEVTTYAQS